MNACLRRSRGVRIRRAGLLLVAAGWLLILAPTTAQTAVPEVYTLEFDGKIDRGLAPYAERVIADAEDAGAAAVVILIDSRGGELDAALRIQRALLDAAIPTIAFVEGEALSEAALIAIAAERVFMAPGALLGAGDDAPSRAPSAVVKRYRATAEERGRDPEIAAAMAERRVSIEGLTTSASALTLTTEEAIEHGYAEGSAADLFTLLEPLGFEAGTRIVETSPSFAEDAVRLVTNPLVAAFLFATGLVLIAGDLLSGGISPLSAGGVLLMTVFFWGHYLAGLAGWEGVTLVALGVALLAVEVLVVPGLGFAGIAGGVGLLAGLYLSLTGGEITTNAERLNAAGMVALVIILGVAGTFLMLWLLPGNARFQGMVLDSRVERDVLPGAPVVPPPPAGDSAMPLAEPDNPHELTEREIEALRLVAAEYSNQEIAEELSISVRTVERHVTNIYDKAGLGNRAEATAYAFRQNFA
jgi:membrane-bound serine protease (ClpP class)